MQGLQEKVINADPSFYYKRTSLRLSMNLTTFEHIH